MALKVGRVLHEDDDFITMEIAKHDKVSFQLQQNEEGETVGGDRFMTLVFVKADDEGEGRAISYDPFGEPS